MFYLYVLSKKTIARFRLLLSVEEKNVNVGCCRSLHDGMNKMIERLEQRIASWSQIPVSHGEPIQVLRYEIGQEYQAHYDYFFHKGGMGNNRIATVLMYLSDVEVRKRSLPFFPRRNACFSSSFFFLSLSVSIFRYLCECTCCLQPPLNMTVFFVLFMSLRVGGWRNGVSQHRKIQCKK